MVRREDTDNQNVTELFHGKPFCYTLLIVIITMFIFLGGNCAPRFCVVKKNVSKFMQLSHERTHIQTSQFQFLRLLQQNHNIK